MRLNDIPWQPYPDAGQFALDAGNYELVARLRGSAIRLVTDAGSVSEIRQEGGAPSGSWGSAEFMVARPMRVQVEVVIGDGDAFIAGVQIMKLDAVGNRTPVRRL